MGYLQAQILPPWGAIGVAAGMTLCGFMFDAGIHTGELTFLSSTFYVLGCLIAVILVHQSGVFTAVVQPPLLLFFTVPIISWLFPHGHLNGLKGLLINCGYPLVERFPLMLFTSAAVLLIGMVRWYVAMTLKPAVHQQNSSQEHASSIPKSNNHSGIRALLAKLTTLLGSPGSNSSLRQSSSARRSPSTKLSRDTRRVTAQRSRRQPPSRQRAQPNSERRQQGYPPRQRKSLESSRRGTGQQVREPFPASLESRQRSVRSTSSGGRESLPRRTRPYPPQSSDRHAQPVDHERSRQNRSRHNEAPRYSSAPYHPRRQPQESSEIPRRLPIRYRGTPPSHTPTENPPFIPPSV